MRETRDIQALADRLSRQQSRLYVRSAALLLCGALAYGVYFAANMYWKITYGRPLVTCLVMHPREGCGPMNRPDAPY